LATTLDQLVIEITATDRGLVAAVNKAKNSFNTLENDSRRSLSVVDAAMVRTARLAATYLGASVFLGFARSSVDAAIKVQALESKMLAATGSAQSAASSMAFLREQSDRLGLNFVSAADGFGSFAAAATRAGLTLDQTKAVFLGVSEAATALQLSPERVGLAFQALSQIAAKGVVSMEELRGQLGEQLPIALDAAARAMGVTQARLIEMVSNGEVSARDFLPRFGDAIRQNLGDAVEKASQGAQANLNRLNNAIVDLQNKMAGGEAIKSYMSAVNSLARAVSDPDVQSGLAAIAEGIGRITEFAVVGIATISRWAAQAISALQQVEAQVQASGYSDAPSRQGLGMAGRRVPTTQQAKGPMDTGSAMLAASGEDLFQGLGRQASSVAGASLGDTVGSSGRDQLQGKIDVLRFQLASETEQIQIEHENRQKLLEEALAKRVITEQEFRDLSLEAELDFKNQYGELWAESSEERVRQEEDVANAILSVRRGSVDALSGLLGTLGQKSKAFAIAQIALEKGRGIAEALIAGRVAAAKALAIYGPTPIGFAAAAKATAFAQLQAGLIAATGLAEVALGGGGGSGSADSAGSVSGADGQVRESVSGSVQRQAPKEIFITIEGEYFGPTQARKLVNSLNEFVGDGSIKLNVTGVAGIA